MDPYIGSVLIGLGFGAVPFAVLLYFVWRIERDTPPRKR